MRALLSAGRGLYTIDAAKLRELQPDVIVTQSLCEVCSIDLCAVEKVAATMTPPPRIVSLNPKNLDEVLDDLLRVRAPAARGRLQRSGPNFPLPPLGRP